MTQSGYSNPDEKTCAFSWFTKLGSMIRVKRYDDDTKHWAYSFVKLVLDCFDTHFRGFWARGNEHIVEKQNTYQKIHVDCTSKNDEKTYFFMENPIPACSEAAHFRAPNRLLCFVELSNLWLLSRNLLDFPKRTGKSSENTLVNCSFHRMVNGSDFANCSILSRNLQPFHGEWQHYIFWNRKSKKWRRYHNAI